MSAPLSLGLPPALLSWAVETLIATTLLMLLVLMLRAPVRRAFGARAAYALWAIPVLRMLLPPLPAQGVEAVPLTPAELVALMQALPIVPEAPAAGGGGWLGWAWLAGVTAFVAVHALLYRRTIRRLLGEARPLGDIGGVAVVESARQDGPLAIGLLRRRIVVPQGFGDLYHADERAMALAHERAHHARGDLIATAAALVVLALHWFNPVAWIALRAFRADQEMACDADVVAARPDARHAYGSAIVKAARAGALSPACHLNSTKLLKGRLKMLNRTLPSSRRRTTGRIAAIGLATAGLGMTASGVAAGPATAIERVGAQAVQAIASAPPAAPAPAAAAVMMTQVAPPAPPAAPRSPVVPGQPARPAPPAPPAPPVAAANTIIVKLRDGKQVFGANMVDETRDCAPGEGRGETMPLIVTERDGKPYRILCENRLTRMVNDARIRGLDAQKLAGTARIQALDAARSGLTAQLRADAARDGAMRMVHILPRDGMGSALASLTRARAALNENTGLSDDARREALAGIDRALDALRDRPVRD